MCRRHNSLVAKTADEPLSKSFAPFVTMLRVERQRGAVGAEFAARNRDGNPVIILGEGFAKELPLNVKRRDERGRIAYAEGDLGILDSLPPEAFSDSTPRNVIAKIGLPEARFTVAADDRIGAGLLKIALHFVAGFVVDVDLKAAQAYLPFIAGREPPLGSMVRTPYLDEDVFPEHWPPYHEVTCYPEGDGLLVTILLFGAYAYMSRLPFATELVDGIRYSQSLGKNYPEFSDGVRRPASLAWDRFTSGDPSEGKAWSDAIERRVRRIDAHGAEQAIRARCERAFDRALRESSNFGNLWERYAAALHLEVFSASEVETIVSIGRRLHEQGGNAWAIPVSTE